MRNKYLVALLLVLLATAPLTSFSLSNTTELEKYKLVPFAKPEAQTFTVPNSWQEIQLMTINQDQLFQLMQGNGKKLNMVIIATSGCGGTPGAIRYIKEVEGKYGSEVNTYLLFSDSYKTSDDVKKVLFKFGYYRPTYIIEKYYGEKPDDRKKGTTFRNSFCEECRKDIIGVPYDLVFGNQLNILLHGYPNYKGPLQDVPKDYIGWLLKNNSKSLPANE